MKIIQQQLELKDWPLTKIGDTKFFGYVVSIGVVTGDWDIEEMACYVDFAYNTRYERYLLPSDENLRIELSKMLLENMNHEHGLYNKVHVTRMENGYFVELP